MWFQTILLATLSLASYGKFALASMGRCHRRCVRSKPSVLHVRCNSIAGLWLAALLTNESAANRVVVIEEDFDANTVKPVEEDDVPLMDAALEAVGMSIVWIDPPQNEVEKPSNEWTVFTPAKTDTATGSSGKIPQAGWDTLIERLRSELKYEDAVPGHEVIHYIDVREEEAGRVELDVGLALDIMGFHRAERNLLGQEFILHEMAEARARAQEVPSSDMVDKEKDV